MPKLLEVNLDISELFQGLKGVSDQLEPAIADETSKLAAQTYGYIVQEATQRLHSTREIYLSNLEPPEQIDEHTWLIKLKEPALFIEDGMERTDMKEKLLQSPKAKTAKDGSKYITVPFKHNKGLSTQTKVQQALSNHIKNELKKREIPYGKIEKNPDGSPKLGALHKFDFTGPKQKHHVATGSEGPQGQHYQAYPRPSGQEGPGGLPWLYRTVIYQHTRQNAAGQDQVQRSIMTFRTVSSKQTSGWEHPGLHPRNLFEKGQQFAEDQLEAVIEAVTRKLGLE